MSAESLVVNPTLHPDNDELRLAPRWGGLIRQGSRQRLGFPGRGRVGLQRQGSRRRLGSPGWGWVGLRRQGSLLWREPAWARRLVSGGRAFPGLSLPPTTCPCTYRAISRGSYLSTQN